MPRSSELAASAVFAVAAACAGVKRADDWHRHLPAPSAELHGAGPFDAMVPDGIWGVGDRVAYTIAVDDGDRTVRFRFELTAIALPQPDPDGFAVVHPVHDRILTRTALEQQPGGGYYAHDPARVRVRLVGDDGTDCGGELDAELLAHWYADSVERLAACGVHELFAVLLQLDCLHAALLRVMRAPSLWSVAQRLGRIEVALQWRGERGLVQPAATPFGELPTLWAPFTILANGQPALDGRIQFTWKHPPLLLGAGVLQVEAWHPDDPTRRLAMRLDTAVRGTPPDAPDRDDLTEGLRRRMSLADAMRTLGGAAVQRSERGVLADGREVEVVQLLGPHQRMHAVVGPGGLLCASVLDDVVLEWLSRRGYVVRP
jgi:hypothetical protein